MKKISLIIVISNLLISICAFSQVSNNPYKARVVIPATPEVSAIGKYSEIPVNYSTGTPQITIPLHKLTTSDLDLPITLNYNASGIRVEESSTWVGLGWNLDYGGAITREVNGLADEINYNPNPGNESIGFMNPILSASQAASLYRDDNLMPQTGTINDYLRDFIPNEAVDIKADIFSFNCFGYSGKFFWSQAEHKFILAPFQNIKLSFEMSGDGKSIEKFMMILPNGIKCYYGKSSDGTRYGVERCIDKTITSYVNDHIVTKINSGYQPITMWCLMDVVSPSGNKISFQYTYCTTKHFGRGGEMAVYKGLENQVTPSGINSELKNEKSYNNFVQRFTKPILSKIFTTKESVEFVLEADVREDVVENEKALHSIIIKNYKNEIISERLLEYYYTTSSESSPMILYGLTGFETIAKKRLILKSVKEKSGLNVLPPYEFAYSDIDLPSRLSESQDYWGYFNNQHSLAHLITPNIRSKYLSDGSFIEGETNYHPAFESYYINRDAGMDRRIYEDYTQAGILKSIKYPTGGHTEYTYESNKASMQYYDKYSGIELSGLMQKKILFPGMLQEGITYTHYESTFEIHNIHNAVELSIKLPQPCLYGMSSTCGITFKIRSLTNPSFSMIYTMSTDENILLPDGTYKITVDIDKGFFSGSSSSMPQLQTGDITLAWQENNDKNNFLVGGLRVKKIVTYDNLGNTVSKSLKYTNPNNEKLSSGYVVYLPQIVKRVPYKLRECFVNTKTLYDDSGRVLLGGSMDLSQCQFSFIGHAYRVHSTSQFVPSFNGTTVKYQYVTEYIDSNSSSFKTEYIFRNPFENYHPTKGTILDVANATIAGDWEIAGLTEKKKYQKNTTSYDLVHHEKQTYVIKDFVGWYTNNNNISTLSGPFELLDADFEMPLVNYIEYYFENGKLTKSEPVPAKNIPCLVKPRGYYSSWFLPESQEEMFLFQGKSINTVHSNQYNLKNLLSKTATTNSKGQLIESKTYYPSDYSMTLSNFQSLINDNLIQLPIKQETIVDGKIKSGIITMYDHKGLPSRIYQYENNTLNTEVPFSSSDIFSTPDYREKLNIYYDAFGNTKQVSKLGDLSEIYLYGYNHQYPVAKIVGSSLNTVQSTITQSILDNPTDDAALRTELTKLRGIAGALVTTYTYKPLVGVTSETDPQGKTIYYEYDNFNRLKLIRDKDNNILKTFDYKYQLQVN